VVSLENTMVDPHSGLAPHTKNDVLGFNRDVQTQWPRIEDIGTPQRVRPTRMPASQGAKAMPVSDQNGFGPLVCNDWPKSHQNGDILQTF
jgi:hypothetical protein